METRETKEDSVIKIVEKLRMVRVRDLKERGINPEYLRRLVKKGRLIRIARGLYSLPDLPHSEHQSLAEVFARIPGGVACLLTALRYHEIGTQAPREIWVALAKHAYRQDVQYPPIRFVYFSGGALTEGIETHLVDGVKVQIYNPAKTIADCFKYRNKIGLDVAQEALRECLRGRKCTADDIWRYAKICRVTNIIKPYLDAGI